MSPNAASARRKVWRWFAAISGVVVCILLVGIAGAEGWRQHDLSLAVAEEVAACRDVESRYSNVGNWDQYWAARAGDAQSGAAFAAAVEDFAGYYESRQASKLRVGEWEEWLAGGSQFRPADSDLHAWLNDTQPASAEIRRAGQGGAFAWPVELRHDDVLMAMLRRSMAWDAAISRAAALAVLGDFQGAESELLALFEAWGKWTMPSSYMEALSIIQCHAKLNQCAALLAERNLLSYSAVSKFLAFKPNIDDLDAAAREGFLSIVAECASQCTDEELAKRADGSNGLFHWLDPRPHVRDRELDFSEVGKRYMLPAMDARANAEVVRWMLAAKDARARGKPTPAWPQAVEWPKSTILRAARALSQYQPDDEDRLVLELRLQWLAFGDLRLAAPGLARVMAVHDRYEVIVAGEELLLGLKDTSANREHEGLRPDCDFRTERPYRRLLGGPK